jgi:hypothetical protein
MTDEQQRNEWAIGLAVKVYVEVISKCLLGFDEKHFEARLLKLAQNILNVEDKLLNNR